MSDITADQNPPEVPTRARRGTRKHPMDYTGKQGEDLARENTDAISDAAQKMSMVTPAPRRRRKSKDVHDLTFANEPKIDVRPVKQVEDKREYVVRLLADIPEMTFGRRVVQQPAFDAEGNLTQAPIVGPLRVLDFKEGELYKVDRPLYERLVFLGYVDPDEYEDD